MHRRLAIFASSMLLSFSIGMVEARDTQLPTADETADASSTDQLPLPRVIFQTDFSKDFSYVLPHRFDTSSVAKSLLDGALVVRIKPGMYGASSDKPNLERAEYAQRIPAGSTGRQSFRLRVDPDFSAPKRTLVAQFKPAVRNASPPLALYLSNGGEVKYVDYQGADDSRGHDQHHIRLAPLDINLLDGQWHEVSMEYWRSDDAGYIHVTIDGKSIVTQEGHDSNPGGDDTLHARIGVYRDAMSIEQAVMFDDWKVEALPPR